MVKVRQALLALLVLAGPLQVLSFSGVRVPASWPTKAANSARVCKRTRAPSRASMSTAGEAAGASIRRKMAPSGLSDVSSWHRARRRAIIAAYPEVAALERPDWKGAVLLIVCNIVLFSCCAAAPALPWLAVIALALTVGATASLWQLTMLHEVVHGTMVKNGGLLQSLLLWVGSFPSVFGYFLYLRFGHLSHHNRLGAHSMAELFSSPHG